MSGPSERGWEAVEHAEERLQERAVARQRTEARRRRRRTWVAWILRIGLPLAGAAAALAIVHAGDLHRWTPTTGALVLAAVLLVPAIVAGITARGDGALDVVLWTLVALAAEVALVFGVGLGLLGLGPG